MYIDVSFVSIMFTVTKRTPQTQTDVEHAVRPSELIYEWVALDQRGELDCFIVCEEKEKDMAAQAQSLRKHDHRAECCRTP